MCWWELGQVIIRFPRPAPAAGPGIVWIQHLSFRLTRGKRPLSPSLHPYGAGAPLVNMTKSSCGPRALWVLNGIKSKQTVTSSLQMQSRELLAGLWVVPTSVSGQHWIFVALLWLDQTGSVIIKWVLSLFSQFLHRLRCESCECH